MTTVAPDTLTMDQTNYGVRIRTVTMARQVYLLTTVHLPTDWPMNRQAQIVAVNLATACAKATLKGQYQTVELELTLAAYHLAVELVTILDVAWSTAAVHPGVCASDAAIAERVREEAMATRDALLRHVIDLQMALGPVPS